MDARSKAYIPLDDSYSITPGGCWEWNRGKTSTGYGKLAAKEYGTKSAHRAMWIRQNGEIPDGAEIDHLCRNRSCVNPSHMRIVTRTGNVRSSAATKLNEDSVADIRRLFASMSHSRIAALFGVSKSAISHISSGRTWADV